VESQSSLALVRDGRVDPLTLGEDANFSMRIEPAPSIDAPLVFAGYGLNIPELGIDDLARLPLEGAVVVYLAASPQSIAAPLQAHFGSAGERWKMYKAAGAIGTLSIANPGSVEIPWARSTLARLQPQMALSDTTLDDTSGQQFAVTMNPAHADKLFVGSGHTFLEILALTDAGKPLPRFALPARVEATVKVEHSEVVSPNVAAVLAGNDQVRRREYVVVSAHLDHVGVGEPVNGDRIYNGAMDNASGIAAVLEIATELQESGARAARSILFVAFAGEEKGELGSRYFAAHPPVPGDSMVANVNIDMFLPLFPLKMVMVLGIDESELGQDIRAVARDRGIGTQADPEPERNRFVRSDQYSFVKFGIPALAMKVGYEPNTPEAAIAAQWTKERYHAPSDDLNQPVDVTAADGYLELARDLVIRIANRASRPRWNPSSFFKRFATAGQ
jgi:Zn-dependent M28 family amino/carboxypeptidase